MKIKAFFLSLLRIFLIITGFIPFILFLKPRYFFVSEKAKKEYKRNKGGVLLIANHTKILDYYCFLYKYAFSYVHTVVAEVVYRDWFMNIANKAMGNIKVDRRNSNNMDAIQTCIDLLNEGKKVLIFPEGKLEDKPGTILPFTKTFIFIASKAGKPIQPFYTDGRYGLFKRPTIVVGEKIDPPTDVSEETLSRCADEIRDYVNELKTICRDHKKIRTKTLFTKKYWVCDFARITSVPIFYFVFPTKKYWIGDRKEIRKAMKYNAILCANHASPCDPLFMYMHFLNRRIRLIAAEDIYCSKFLSFCMNQSGVIPYHRKALNESMDLKAFKESVETLNGRGVLGIFPEGHMNFDVSFDSSFKEGAATLSLMTNSPIIPFIYIEPYKYFCFNHIVMGNPIYPSEYGFKKGDVDIDNINKYNDIIYSKMKELYDYSLTKRRKKYGKRRGFSSLEKDAEKDHS